MGWSPAALRSRIASLRCPSTASGQLSIRSWSGPLRRRAPTIAPTALHAVSRCPAATNPAMPHISPLSQTAGGKCAIMTNMSRHLLSLAVMSLLTGCVYAQVSFAFFDGYDDFLVVHRAAFEDT